MGKLKHTFLITAFMLCSSFCFAKQISFQVIQHDGVNDQIIESSFVVEDELLYGFFESGHIVSNEPAVISKSPKQDESLWSRGVGDAYEGCADYFVQVKLFYIEEIESLYQIDWSVTSVKTGEKIKNSSIKNTKAKLELDDLKDISSSVVYEVNKVIKANKA